MVKETLGDLRRLCISNLDTGNAGQDHGETLNALKALNLSLGFKALGFRV